MHGKIKTHKSQHQEEEEEVVMHQEDRVRGGSGDTADDHLQHAPTFLKYIISRHTRTHARKKYTRKSTQSTQEGTAGAGACGTDLKWVCSKEWPVCRETSTCLFNLIGKRLVDIILVEFEFEVISMRHRVNIVSNS